MKPRAARSLPLLALLLLAPACGGSDGKPDAGPSDAALAADSGEILPDAGATTTCGVEGDMQICDRATEICVQRELGAGFTYSCEPLPDGCDADRSCAACQAVCTAPADTCDDTGQDNTISCACPQCA